MKKNLLSLFLMIICTGALAQDKTAAKSPLQFLLIIRFKSDFVPPSNDVVQKNIRRWQDYMGDLGKNGKIAGGYRPGNDGITISGKEQVEKKGPYIADDELVSSILLINAADMNEARAISLKCPVFEFGGSVEVRPIANTAN